MDNFNGSVKPINIDDSIEENPDLNSAPIPSESEISNNTPTPNINYVNEQYNNQNIIVIIKTPNNNIIIYNI